MRTLADSSITQCKHKRLLYIIFTRILDTQECTQVIASPRICEYTCMHASISKCAHNLVSRTWVKFSQLDSLNCCSIGDPNTIFIITSSPEELNRKKPSCSRKKVASTTLSITKTKCTGPRQPFFLEYSDSQRVHIKL
jgi:hypothetical protein